MPDDIDRAQERDLEYQADCERERRHRSTQKRIRPTGFCLYCAEPLPAARPFCDVDCRDAYDYELRLKRMHGVK